MQMTKNHPDLRHDAMMLAWAISKELKNISPSDFIESVCFWKQLGDAVEYLLSFACDDWPEIEGTCQELESKEFPACLPYLNPALQINKRWQEFVKGVAEAEGVAEVATKDQLPDDARKKFIPHVSKEQYAAIGHENEFLQNKKQWLKPPVTILK